MKKLLFGLAIIAVAAFASDPKQRTRVLTAAGGTNQWLASFGVTNVAYTNDFVYLTLLESQSFFVPGDEVVVRGTGDATVDDLFFRVRSSSANKLVLNVLPASSNYTAVVGQVMLTERFSTLTLIGAKHPRTNNTGSVRVGITTNNLTQPFVVAPGEYLIMEQSDGIALTNWSLTVDVVGDGATIFYFPRP